MDVCTLMNTMTKRLALQAESNRLSLDFDLTFRLFSLTKTARFRYSTTSQVLSYNTHRKGARLRAAQNESGVKFKSLFVIRALASHLNIYPISSISSTAWTNPARVRQVLEAAAADSV